MKIGILGSGNVGGTLGARWARAGHDVTFGSRRPDSPEIQALVDRAGSTARAADPASTVAASQVLLLATPWNATRAVLASAGSVAGKVLLDATNPLTEGARGLALGHTTSGAEQVADWAAGAKVVKIFNTVGFNVMADPDFGGQAASMLHCGDDPEAKTIAARLASDLGFDPIDLGPLSEARLLEPMALAWIHLALFRGRGRDIAFRLLHR